MQHVLCTSLEESPQTNPIIGRIDCKSGHGAGRPTQKMVTISDPGWFSLLSFVISSLKFDIYLPDWWSCWPVQFYG